MHSLLFKDTSLRSSLKDNVRNFYRINNTVLLPYNFPYLENHFLELFELIDQQSDFFLTAY